MFIDLEPLKKLYQEILNTQAISQKELQELEILIKKLQEVKEELDNSSFTILKKNTQLIKKSKAILTGIEDLSNLLNMIQEKIKVTFDEEIKIKLNKLIKDFDSQLTSLSRKINTEKYYIENQFEDTKEIIKKEEEELENIRKKYEKKLESSLNDFKKKLDEYDAEIAHKTFFKRWGAVFISFSIGAIITIAIIFYFFKKDIIFSLKYSSTCYNHNTYECYKIPTNPNIITITDDQKNILIKK